MYTSPEAITRLAAELINIRSLSGDEHQVMQFVCDLFDKIGWKVARFPVVDGRENLMVTFGTPRIVFTTHLDVVPAPDALFSARIEGDILYGRGACDAKGIAATMIGAVQRLLEKGAKNIGLLFVVGEEADGCGADQAARDLKGMGIEYIINGEPTEGKLVKAQKGIVGVEVEFVGRACHSGYPELGIDANMRLVDAIERLRQVNLGFDEVLGSAKINFGLIQGGVASNVVSPQAKLNFLVRTVTASSGVIEKIHATVGELGIVTVNGVAEPAHMITVPGFDTGIAAYYTDIAGFAPLGAKALLYGPGSIFDAHTDGEKVTIPQIAEACSGYERIFHELTSGSY